jgi:hypothetical protein
MMKYLQIRENGKRDVSLYSSLLDACKALVLVQHNRPSAHVVELDTPGGAVVREFTLTECQEILNEFQEILQYLPHRDLSESARDLFQL